MFLATRKSIATNTSKTKRTLKSNFVVNFFSCSIGRLILTKKPFLFDPNGDIDREDITEQYKAKEGTEAERLSLFNAVRGTHLAKRLIYLF